MIRSILCFGDSNTYGVNPEDNSRFPLSIRWTGRLQSLLGHEGYQVVEEGTAEEPHAFPMTPMR